MATVFIGLSKHLRRFSTDQAGNVTIIFGLALIPIIGFVGASVDYSRANSARAAMQSAVDATALALAKDAGHLSSDELEAQASQRFSALFTRPETINVHVNAAYTPQEQSVTVSAEGSIRSTVLQTLGFGQFEISTRSKATYSYDGLGCVLALDPKGSGAATAQGSAIVNLKGCSLYDDSSNATALIAGGSAKISALSVGVVGGISGIASIATTNGVRTGMTAVADPYVDVKLPPFSGCDQRNFSSHTAVTINPGVYCGGMQLNANANVTLKPGLYYLDGGGLQVNGGATLTGDGVTLVFTSSSMGNWATATINGGATVNLTPPATGPTVGIVMFGDRQAPVGTTYKFNGGASQYFAGAIYFPTGAVNFSGGMSTSTSCTKIIADTITFSGNSDLAINCSRYNTKEFGLKLLTLSQ